MCYGTSVGDVKTEQCNICCSDTVANTQIQTVNPKQCNVSCRDKVANKQIQTVDPEHCTFAVMLPSLTHQYKLSIQNIAPFS